MELKVVQSGKPPCFDHPPFKPEGIWRLGCPHWYEGGNADQMTVNVARGGPYPWASCEGCEHKRVALAQQAAVEAPKASHAG